MAGVIINILAKDKYSTTEIVTKKRIKFFSVTNNENNEYNSLLNAIINSLNGSATMLKINIQSDYLEKVKRLISNSETYSSSLEKIFLSKINEISDKKYIKIGELTSYQKLVLEKNMNQYIMEEKERIKLEKENKKKCNPELPTAEDAEIEINSDEIIDIVTTEEEVIIDNSNELIGFDETFDPNSIIVGVEFEQTSPDIINIDDI